MTLEGASKKAIELALAPPPTTNEAASERRDMIREIAGVLMAHGAVEELGEE